MNDSHPADETGGGADSTTEIEIRVDAERLALPADPPTDGGPGPDPLDSTDITEMEPFDAPTAVDPDDTVTEDMSRDPTIVSRVALYARYQEIKQQIKSFDTYIGDASEVGITLHKFFDFTNVRLRSLVVYGSGTISLLGEDADGRLVSLYDNVRDCAFALSQLPVRDGQKKRPVSFCFAEAGRIVKLED